jgi:hypothetical protein
MNFFMGLAIGETGLSLERTGLAPNVSERKMIVVMQDSFFILDSLSFNITAQISTEQVVRQEGKRKALDLEVCVN